METSDERFPPGMTVQSLAQMREKGMTYAMIPWECYDGWPPLEKAACGCLSVDAAKAVTFVCLRDDDHHGPCGWMEGALDAPYAL